MKRTIFLLFCLPFAGSAMGQNAFSPKQIDSLTQLLAVAETDSARFELNMLIGIGHQYLKPNESARAFSAALEIARKMGKKDKIAGCLVTFAYMYSYIGEPAKAIEMNLEALRIQEELRDDTSMPLAFISENYEAQGDLENALTYARKSFWVYEKRRRDGLKPDERGYPAGPMKLGVLFEKSKQLDSAMHYALLAKQRISEQPAEGIWAFFYCSIYNLLGTVYSRQGQPGEAIRYFRLALGKAEGEGFQTSVQEGQLALARFYEKQGQPDSVVFFAIKAYENALSLKHFNTMENAAALLRSAYEKQGIFEKALHYNDLAIAARDSMTGAEKVREVQRLTNREEQRQLKMRQEAEAAQLAFKNKIKFWAVLAVLGGALLLAFILFRNNRQKQRANALLKAQKEEIETQKVQLQISIETLKATQAQLIQSEKLASLGELTAGIAHEIQNPLNFVNNFSELSVDIAKDLKEEINRADVDKEYVGELLSDLFQNQEKINHHGKRAASIVTGMLQHSRVGGGKKEPTDLNALADEYLRMSYHGLRAKDSGFNASMPTNFEPTIGKVEAVPQDMGRVFLNIINNAFYATQQRLKEIGKSEIPYEPVVSVSSRMVPPLGSQGAGAGVVEFRIKDNGRGIPDDVKAKIFQPFFTTKPTGQGTGLGLSLAYEIVVKGHGGKLEVETKVGEGTEFIISLPLNKN